MAPRTRLLSIVVAAASLFTLGLAAGRATAPPLADSSASEPQRAPRDHSPTADPSDVPASSTEGGYARSREGAVAAATAYGLALDGAAVLDADRRAAVIDVIAAEDVRADLAELFDRAAGLISTQLGVTSRSAAEPSFVWRVVPGGWLVRSYDPSHATVAVWATTIVMHGDLLLAPPSWRTTEVELVWERDAWRLSGFHTEPGPSPTAITTDGASGIARSINVFEPYRYEPASGAGR